MIAREPADAVPPAVRAAALGAFGAVDRDALVLDAVDDDASRASRQRTFRGEGVEVRVHVDGAQLQVWVDPPADGELLLETPGASPAPFETGDGFHRLTPLPVGPGALVLTVRGRRLRTAWSTFSSG